MRRNYETALHGMIVLAALLISFVPLAHASNQSVVFHFYGAQDCPPCMAFKRDGLPIVQQAAAEVGFDISVNIAKRTRDVTTVGAFGEVDGLLRQAGKQIGSVYPPVFFISKNEKIVSVHGHKWRAALASAKQEAAKVKFD